MKPRTVESSRWVVMLGWSMASEEGVLQGGSTVGLGSQRRPGM